MRTFYKRTITKEGDLPVFNFIKFKVIKGDNPLPKSLF